MKSVLELHNRNDVQFETADDLSRYEFEDLKLFSGIYIGGGNTWNLMKEFKDSGFSKSLIQYLQFGGQVYGGSAGAIILGKRIDTHDDENKIEMKNLSGFDLLHDYSVACHFKNDQNARFVKWAINNKLSIICLPEETGLIIKTTLRHVSELSRAQFILQMAQKMISIPENHLTYKNTHIVMTWVLVTF